ncbi:MAG: cupin domain-containing protein [bacterium]
MEIVKADRTHAGPPDRPQYFSGTVLMQPLHTEQPPGSPEIVAVFFEPGARTIPHVHSTDQVLYFTEGEGLVVTDWQRRTLRAGEIVVIPGGMWHWHGATRTQGAVHVSIKPAGPTDWEVERKDWDNY